MYKRQLIFILIISVAGGVIILISSIRYVAIKLNQFLVTVIQHIAACDLLRAVSYVFPTVVSLVKETWVFGKPAGNAHFLCNLGSFLVSNYLFCVLAGGKLLILRCPLWSRRLSSRAAHVVSTVVWVVSFLLLVGMYFTGVQHILMFDFMKYTVTIHITSPSLQYTYHVIYIIIALTLPTVILILETVSTLHFLYQSRAVSARSGGVMRWQGLVTVLTTVLFYCCLLYTSPSPRD